MKPEQKLKQILKVISKRYNLKNPEEDITITFTRQEWYHIWEEARHDLGFTNQDTEVIERLKSIIEEK